MKKDPLTEFDTIIAGEVLECAFKEGVKGRGDSQELIQLYEGLSRVQFPAGKDDRRACPWISFSLFHSF